jgi:hypothetical protein
MTASAITTECAKAAARRGAAADDYVADMSAARSAVNIVVSAAGSTARRLAKGIWLETSEFVDTVATLAATCGDGKRYSCEYSEFDFRGFAHGG